MTCCSEHMLRVIGQDLEDEEVDVDRDRRRHGPNTARVQDAVSFLGRSGRALTLSELGVFSSLSLSVLPTKA
jgi:hypothetical protein